MLVTGFELLYLLPEYDPLLETVSWHRHWLPGRQWGYRESGSASAFDESSSKFRPLRRPASQCIASLCHQITNHSPGAHPNPPHHLPAVGLPASGVALGRRPFSNQRDLSNDRSTVPPTTAFSNHLTLRHKNIQEFACNSRPYIKTLVRTTSSVSYQLIS